jgi:hypothetical protein
MSSNNNSGGLGLLSTLVVVFAVLKLTDNIDWSWTWVFSPWWIPLSIIMALILLVLFGKLLALPFTLRKNRNKFDRDVEQAMQRNNSSNKRP